MTYYISLFSYLHKCISQKSISSSKRLWWCPTGPFAFLPLHAAGIYNGDATKLEDVSDYTISSYTLTLDGMLAPLPHTPDDFKMLTVIQPTIPGQPQLSLPFTCKELSKIEQEVPQQFLIKLGTAEEPTSIEKVLHHLSNVSIAHFACHGVQNLRSPLDSALLLSDGHLKVSKIMQLAMPNASLAYLSACQTAMGDEEIPDEALHIAGTMLFSGFHSVVGTMW
jgi:CHAT domain-containing protein